ncbi:MAG: hypothetical protein KAI17_17195, partial [Thiotrichaceae bacterium]|nr:hypothetical protein [Thiotrichaceae bacterium]
MQHVIQRQTIAINTADMESAKIVQQYMDILLKPQLITMMDEVFSSFSADRTTIRLEKLELDLGSFSMDNLDTQFTEKLKKQLIKELKKELL